MIQPLPALSVIVILSTHSPNGPPHGSKRWASVTKIGMWL
jgi:hypothetical protein